MTAKYYVDTKLLINKIIIHFKNNFLMKNFMRHAQFQASVNTNSKDLTTLHA